MKLPMFQVDAFAAGVFSGNPAAVVALEGEWLPDELMQAIAAENNLSETAFVRPRGADLWGLRWLTPTVEVDLCGHATLASAFVITTRLSPGLDRVRFETRSGLLEVTRADERFTLDFPAMPASPCATPPGLSEALGATPRECLQARDLVAVFDSEAQVRALAPDFRALARAAPTSVIATAPGDADDFVSRFFAPNHGIDEDPVTGSAHCTLTPLWAARLGKRALSARQVSRRGGLLACQDRGARVSIAGTAVLYLEGSIVV